jgi:hypothetical protein
VSGTWFNSAQSSHVLFVEQGAPDTPGAPHRMHACWYGQEGGQPVWLIGVDDTLPGYGVGSLAMNRPTEHKGHACN